MNATNSKNYAQDTNSVKLDSDNISGTKKRKNNCC